MKKYDHLIEDLRGCLVEYMAQKGYVVRGRHKMIRCLNPDHQDDTPSMSYYAKAQQMHCFGCGANYDLFDLIGLDYPECDTFPKRVRMACSLFGREYPADFAAQESGSGKPATKKTPPKPHTPSPSELDLPDSRQQDAADYSAMVEQAIAQNGAGGAYFQKRGIDPDTCKKYRLFEKDGRAWMPVYQGGRCVCYCTRAIADDLTPRYKNSPGAMEIFGADLFAGEGQGGPLFVTESILDALSAEQLGYHAVALCGAANVRKFLSLCAQNPAAANRYAIIAAGDRDQAGERMGRELKEGLAAMGISCGQLQLPETVKDINELLMKDPAQLKNCLESAASADCAAYAQTSAAYAIGELLDQAVRRGGRQAIPTGFAALDDVLDGGFYTGLYIIGAISSLGKTSFVLQIADHLAEQGQDVLYFSLEMGRIELMAKSISRESFLQAQNPEDALTARQVLRLGQLEPARAALLAESIETYRRKADRLFIREGLADIGAGEIRDAVREHIRLRGRKPLVVVDYLQILKPSDPRATDKQNTDRAVVELKRVSRDFDLPVFAVSSFNRENYRAAVSMEAFKESGAVEYSSDVLLGLQLAGAGEPGLDLNAEKARTPRRLELVLLKNRCGLPYAKIPYAYYAKYSCFQEQKGKGTKMIYTPGKY